MKTIQLLNEKNHFLEKFYSLNENQLVQLTTGRFENIEVFYNQREDLLKIIKYIDSQLIQAEKAENSSQTKITQDDQDNVREALRVKDLFVSRIIEQDVQIISIIDKLKSDIIQELKSIRASKRALSGYKSGMAS